MFSKELIKGTLPTLILRVLEENQRMYGYSITQKVKEMTDGKILIKEGSLYPILHNLLDEGLLSVEEVYIGKRVRKYYSLTKEGNNKLSVMKSDLMDFINTLSQLFNPGSVQLS